VDLTDDERDLILAALFELQLTRSAFDGDPDADRIPFARISHDDILAVVDKLGGDRDTALFGAYRDEWAELDAPVPEYPADETDEG
jgi:elongation factor P hydroxylase